ncbi:hypothetical protein TNIN_291691 [Trichonephila inaurata madagascariensis]|uniref:Uncharacterized protein n=1 Tax=Trichonephila inaurata madagascariensis TaxID=2747483 RepID=A0A8X6X1S7_9ARAC|nr:hypothetical protein TNIN_291691 [Trichonephila inaurata madagascariensis]
MLSKTCSDNDERVSIPNFDCCPEFKRPGSKAAGVTNYRKQKNSHVVNPLLFSEFLVSKSGLISDCGQSVDGNVNYSGPSHHLDQLKFSILQSLDGRSAGFKEPEMCLHSAGLVNFMISWTRLNTHTP